MFNDEAPKLGERVVEEFDEGNLGIQSLIETLIKSFLKSNSDYGAIKDIKDLPSVVSFLRSYIQKEKLDVYALRFKDEILLSRTSLRFERLYDVIKKYSTIQLKENLIEVWDDKENRVLHLLIVPLRKHFPIEYSNQKDREDDLRTILEETKIIKDAINQTSGLKSNTGT